MRSQLNAAKTCTIGENSIGNDQRCFDGIDFYGACDESPTGMDQVMAQRREEQYRLETDYED